MSPADEKTFQKYEPYLRSDSDSSVIDAVNDGRRVILGLRRPTNTHANDGLGVYDDTFVVLWKEGAAGRALEFVGNTEPSAYYEDTGDGTTVNGTAAVGVDADGDGVLDLARIPAGVHIYRKGGSKKWGDRVLRSVNTIRVERDTNHDGTFRADNSATAQDGDAQMVSDLLFHPGLPDRTGSAGGQTMPPDVYEQFWAALGDQDVFHYLLVEA